MRHLAIFGLLLLGVSQTGCASGPVRPAERVIAIADDIVLHRLDTGVWVHTTYVEVQGYGRVGANGLIVRDGAEAMLIDLPWTDQQTAALFDWVARNWGVVVTQVVPTHFHEDCMGGLAEAQRRGAASHALDKTVALAEQRRLPVPQHPFTEEWALQCGSTAVTVRYLGAGHTTDNVVAWIPEKRILFGGCLIKAMSAESLGNTRDGDLAAYPETLRRVRDAFPRAATVVPGHGTWGGPDLIDHTLNLCQRNGR